MNPWELEVIQRHLARAKPPPKLHRYRKPHEWTLKEISERLLHLTMPDDQNDPFDERAPITWNRESLRRNFVEQHLPRAGLSSSAAEAQFETHYEFILAEAQASYDKNRKDSGMICFSAVPDSIRMWSYYAQSHEGVCLGFDTTKHPFFAARKVRYQNPAKPVDVAAVVGSDDPSELSELVTFTKAAEWEFEQEYRISVGQIGNNPRLVPFDPQALIEVRFGAKIKDDYREQVLVAVKRLPKQPKLIQMRCDFDRFVLIEEEIAP